MKKKLIALAMAVAFGVPAAAFAQGHERDHLWHVQRVVRAG
jgi:hypothetical protein